MRLVEFIAPPERVLVTNEFNETYSSFSSANPQLINEKFKKWLSQKLEGLPTTNDYAFQSKSPLGTYYHYHIIKGKMIIVYKKVGNDLRLYIVVEHKDYEGKAAVRLANWIESLSDADFTELDLESFFNGPKAEQKLLTPEEKDEVIKQVFDIVAAGGMYILKPAVEKNDWSNFFEWLESENIYLDHDAVFAAFGGVNKLTQFIKDAVAKYGQQDAYNKA